MAWAACWTLPRSRPSRQLGEQGSWGGSCPMSTGLPVFLLSIMVPSVPPFLSSSVYFSVLHLALLCLSETEGSLRDLKCQGCSLHPICAESGTRHLSEAQAGCEPLHSPPGCSCRGFLQLSLWTKAASTIKGHLWSSLESHPPCPAVGLPCGPGSSPPGPRGCRVAGATFL